MWFKPLQHKLSIQRTMRKVAANLIFTGVGNPIKNGHIVVDDNGFIVDVVDTGGEIIEIEGLEYFNGILIPGLVLGCKNVEMTEQLSKVLWRMGVQAIAGNNISATAKLQTQAIITNMADDQLVQLQPNQFNFLQQSEDYNFEQWLGKLTSDAAKNLNLQFCFGSFQKGIKPGILLVSPFNFATNSLLADSVVTRLV